MWSAPRGQPAACGRFASLKNSKPATKLRRIFTRAAQDAAADPPEIPEGGDYQTDPLSWVQQPWQGSSPENDGDWMNEYAPQGGDYFPQP
jgi:hypothetical protein